jgi:ABC-type phosphate/phosphonate transport system substrate-binding protein
MYVAPPPVAQATDDLWRFLRDFLRAGGMQQVPESLDRGMSHSEAWLQPNLLLAQTCGFPYVKTLRGRVRLVATPCYGYPGCDGPQMRSFVIARTGAGPSSLQDLRGSTVAINSRDSNSGMNLLRAAIAPISAGARFFASVVETGGHLASISAVAEGRADCAAIDCITFGHVQRFAPELLEKIAVIEQTPAGPGLPFVTRGSASDLDVSLMRAALDAAVLEPTLATVCDTLALKSFARLGDEDYDGLLALESEAARLGYGQIG